MTWHFRREKRQKFSSFRSVPVTPWLHIYCWTLEARYENGGKIKETEERKNKGWDIIQRYLNYFRIGDEKLNFPRAQSVAIHYSWVLPRSPGRVTELACISSNAPQVKNQIEIEMILQVEILSWIQIQVEFWKF